MGRFEKDIFGGPLTNILPELNKYSAAIAELFSDQHTIGTKEELQAVVKLIRDAENILVQKKSKNPNTLTFLEKLKRGASIANNTPFLRDSTIERILYEQPPANLKRVITSFKLELSPREQLAISRFSEDKNWQNNYHKKLSNLSWEDFENKEISITRLNEEQISEFDIPTKPWGLSHSKECGVILVFDHETAIETPTLLQASVLLHYLYEVHHFSKFLYQHKELRPGELAVNIIRGKRPMLHFLTDGNAHDETYYWQRAIDCLDNQGILKTQLIQKHLMRMTDSGASMNFIDVLWNLNKIQNRSDHIYHLQQEAWVELMRMITGLTETDFSTFLEKQLMLDNLSFLEKVLK